MEKKVKVLVYLPRKIYVELHERQLTNHISYLVSRLLEEFFKTGVQISWREMQSKPEQREYLERKLKEFLSGKLESSSAPTPEPTKDEPQSELRDWKEEFKKRFEQFWD